MRETEDHNNCRQKIPPKNEHSYEMIVARDAGGQQSYPKLKVSYVQKKKIWFQFTSAKTSTTVILIKIYDLSILSVKAELAYEKLTTGILYVFLCSCVCMEM